MKHNRTRIPPALRPAEFGFFIAGCAFSCLLILELALEVFFTLHLSARIFLVLAACVSYYIAAYLYADRTGKVGRLRGIQILLFVVYLSVVIDITLIGTAVGRLHFPGAREDYIELFVNFKPFKTIKDYLRGFGNGYVSFFRLSLNLLGNILLLAPLAFFLPLLFKYERKWFVFLPSVLLFSVCVEALQYLFMIGSCDVDDLILNFLGATALFFLLKIPPLRRLIRTITKSEF